MRAWTLTAHGDPQQVLALRDHAEPVPGRGQVLVRCEGFGLNYADVMAVRGLYREAPPVPSVLGYEVAGHVERTGPDAPAHLVGRRVVAMTRFGGYAELAVTDHRACAIIPDDLPLGEAAALATQGCTAWYAARMLCPLRSGERVLVHSAAGGVGHVLVQLALASGCEVFTLASGARKLAFLRGLGVQHAIDRRAPGHREQLLDLLGGARLDVSFNAVGGSSFGQDMRSIGSGGRIVLFGGAQRGALGAFGTLRFVWNMGVVVPILLMMKSRSILGINMLRIAEHKPEVLAECLREVVQAHARGVVRPHVQAEYPAAELPAALAALAGGDTLGKVVVRW
jgi:NADPH:quinone reductase-like Zn-dependent oxidoreductase